LASRRLNTSDVPFHSSREIFPSPFLSIASIFARAWEARLASTTDCGVVTAGVVTVGVVTVGVVCTIADPAQRRTKGAVVVNLNLMSSANRIAARPLLHASDQSRTTSK